MTGFAAWWSALARAARDECLGVLSRPREWTTALLLPILWTVIFALIFHTGLMTALPVGVVDLDRSSASRAAVRLVESLPSVAPVSFATPAEAEEAMRSSKIYGTITIPPNYERDGLRGEGSPVILSLNKTYYAVGTILEVDVKSALAAAKFEAAAAALTKAGGSFSANAARLRVSLPEVYFLGNTAFNFAAYLLPTLIPGLLGLAAMLALSSSMVREWRDGGLARALARADGFASALILGKLLPGVVFFTLALSVWASWFGLDWQPAGPVWAWHLAGLLLVLAMAGMAVLSAALSPTWVIALTMNVCLIAPSFPFTGFSFPLDSMTPGAAFFGSLLPLTHYLRAQAEVWILGSPVDHILGTLAGLALFSVILFGAGLPLLARRIAKLAENEAERFAQEDREERAAEERETPAGFFTAFARTFRGAVVNRDTFAVFAGGVAFYLIFYGWPYSNQQIENVPVGVVDLDRSSESRRLISALAAAPTTELKFVLHDEREGLEALKREATDVLLTIPHDYERRIARGENATLHLVGNGAFPVKARAVQSSLAAIATDAAATADAASWRTPGLPASSLSAAKVARPGLIVEYRYNTISGYANYTVPIVGPVIIQAIMLMGVSLSLGGWLAARRTPDFLRHALSRTPDFLGLFAAFWSIAFFWTLYTEGFAFSTMQYGTLADPVATLLAGTLFSASISAMALAATLLIGTNAWSTPAVVITAAPTLFLSGTIWPREGILNPIVSGFAELLPTTPGLPALAAASQDGASAAALAPELAHLSALLLLYLLLAFWAARRITARKAAL